MNIDLLHYIDQARKSGMPDEKIRQGLLQSGWPMNDVNEAIMKTPAAVTPQSKPKAMMPKSMAVTFIVVAIAVAGYFAGAYYMANYQNLPLWPFETKVFPLAGGPTVTPLPAVEQSPANNGYSYVNTLFGFSLALPSSWDGYMIDHLKEDIYDVTGKTKTNNGVVGSFEIIELYHPLKTAQNSQEDMPIYIFTPTQWEHIQKGEWSVGAAPIPPSLLGQNSQWIMALPARYNYDFEPGWEEVDQILHTLQAFEPTGY